MKHHILLIEDNTEIRENTAEILELANYKVTTAENGKVGVELALNDKPDIIICDVMMPVLDGYGVLHLINKNEQLTGIPFIFLTAKSDRSDFRKGMEMGADDYITKPFTDIELLNALESRLKKAELQKKNYPHSEEGFQHLIDTYGGSDALKQITENKEENFYKKKYTIYHYGNHPQKLYYILSGKVKTFVTNEDGKDLTIGLYSKGDFFGYTALLEGGTYKETAETLDDTQLAEIPVDEFKKMLQQNPEVNRQFIRLLANNITEKEQQLLNIAYNSLRKRVATALVTLKQKYQDDGSNPFSIQISREDLSNIAGTATESLIRTLGDFKGEKLIEIQGSKITILNEKKLADMLN